MRFRKLPITIDAYPVSQLLVDAAHNWAALPVWLREAYEGRDVTTKGIVLARDHISLTAHDGTITCADYNDWIVRDASGRLYPVKPDIFARTYEPIT